MEGIVFFHRFSSIKFNSYGYITMYISHNSRRNLCRKQRMRKCYVITWKMYAQCLAGTVTNNSIGQNMLSARNHGR